MGNIKSPESSVMGKIWSHPFFCGFCSERMTWNTRKCVLSGKLLAQQDFFLIYSIYDQLFWFHFIITETFYWGKKENWKNMVILVSTLWASGILKNPFKGDIRIILLPSGTGIDFGSWLALVTSHNCVLWPTHIW